MMDVILKMWKIAEISCNLLFIQGKHLAQLFDRLVEGLLAQISINVNNTYFNTVLHTCCCNKGPLLFR